MRNKWIRISGILGIFGGIMLFAGDMLLYYNGEQTDKLMNMATASDERIIVSGVFALLATWLYLFGLIPIYLAFRPVSSSIRQAVVMLFAGILIAYGVVHGAYMAIATTAKLALNNQLDLDSSSKLAIEINNAIRLFVYPLFAVLSIIFIYHVWRKKTHYPRWMVFFFPLFPFLLNGLITSSLHGKWEVIIAGGYLNLILVVFFTASLISLWRKPL